MRHRRAWAPGLVIAMLWASCVGAQVPAPAPPPPSSGAAQPADAAQAATVRELLAEPGRFAGRPVTVRGRLIAEGNYFSRNSKLFLVDDEARRLEVRPWLPRSTPPPRGDAQPAGPPTQADFLDQRVELTGRLRPATTEAAPAAPALEVTSARILPP